MNMCPMPNKVKLFLLQTFNLHIRLLRISFHSMRYKQTYASTSTFLGDQICFANKANKKYMTWSPALFCLRLQKNARQVCQFLGILHDVILGRFMVFNGEWGRCRCLIWHISSVANNSVLFIAVTATGRIGWLSALRVSC